MKHGYIKKSSELVFETNNAKTGICVKMSLTSLLNTLLTAKFHTWDSYIYLFS